MLLQQRADETAVEEEISGRSSDEAMARLDTAQVRLRPFDLDDLSSNLLARSRAGFVAADQAVGFVMQSGEHWWLIRRFGRGGSTITGQQQAGAGEGPVWYLLDPYRPAPVRLAAAFVGEVLLDAHDEGYAVMRAEAEGEEAMERFLASLADEMVDARVKAAAAADGAEEEDLELSG